MDRLDSWHLLATVVDPQYQGKGIIQILLSFLPMFTCYQGLFSLMMKEGFQRTAPKPVHLESSPNLRKYAAFELALRYWELQTQLPRVFVEVERTLVSKVNYACVRIRRKSISSQKMVSTVCTEEGASKIRTLSIEGA